MYVQYYNKGSIKISFMENIKRILTRKLRPILLHVIGEKLYSDNDKLQSDIDYIKSLSDSNLKFIEDNDLRQWILGLSNTIVIYRNELNSSLIKFMIDDSINVFKVYSYLNDLDSSDSYESTKMIDEYLEFMNDKIDERSLEMGRRFGYLLSSSKANGRSVSEDNVSISDLEKLIKDDFNNIIDISHENDNYRINEIMSAYSFLFESTKNKEDINDKLESALSNDNLEDSNKLEEIIKLAMSDRYKDLDISKNIIYLLNHPVTSLMNDKWKLNSVISLIKEYGKERERQ